MSFKEFTEEGGNKVLINTHSILKIGVTKDKVFFYGKAPFMIYVKESYEEVKAILSDAS